MSEIVKFECACNAGYDKGALKKTLENNIFTIFGNLNQKNSIVIRYHGVLTESDINDLTTYNMFFYFDDLKSEKQIVKLQKCNKCAGECYCCTLDLDMYNTLNFGFFDNNNVCELNCDKPFQLKISPDPISNIMQRYGFEQNTNLPVVESDKDKISSFEGILNIIKTFFNSIFKKAS